MQVYHGGYTEIFEIDLSKGHSKNSLQLLKKTDTKYTSYVVRITEPIIENLITDLNIDDEKAADIFYTSKTFSLLSDKNTELYKKSWQEIYNELNNELNLKSR